jgi:MerR family transcriptional regulator, light-induced transcriptional regulator
MAIDGDKLKRAEEQVRMEIKHSLKAVVKQTGLSPFLIRAWERRYNAISPSRSDTKRRLYTNDDIIRLALLKKATQCGENIGNIANLANDDLRKIIGENSIMNNQFPIINEDGKNDLTANDYFSQALESIQESNFDEFEAKLMEASVALSFPSLLDQVISPLLDKVGTMWQNGELRIADEHRISAITRSFLGTYIKSDRRSVGNKCLVSTTPTGQFHELGALMASLSASVMGWRSIFLGPNLPPEEIAGSVKVNDASVLALSIIYPMDDPYLGSELVRLRRLIGNDIQILIGGRAAGNYASFIRDISATYVPNLDELRKYLEGNISQNLSHGNNNE